MSIAKFAAALHAFADALMEDAEGEVEKVVAAVKGKGKKAAATPVVDPTPASGAVQPTAATASVPAVAPAAATAPAAVTSSITKDQLNKVVLKVAAKDRDAAEAILARFGAKNTVTMPPEQWQAVYDAFEEEIAKQDAAAVQVAQASLV
jgi:hypothetical protein